MSLANKLEWAAAFILPVYGAYEIVWLYNTKSYLSHNLVLPFLVCLVGIAKIQYNWWFRRIGLVTINDTKLIMYLSMLNSVAIINLVTLLPYTIISLCISCYFQYIMIRVINIVLRHCFIALANNNRRSSDSSISSDAMSSWRVTHDMDTKRKDTCLVCLEQLNETEYVHVCLHVVNDHVDVQFHISRLVLQCTTCGCTLHVNCQLMCRGKCPICAR